jgi:serine/threonine-protein kinase RsbW
MDEPHPGKTMNADAAPNAAPVNSGHAPDETPTMVDSVRITIPSRSEYVRVVRLAVLGIASRMAFSYDDVEDIKLAVSEACNNAILHADATLAQDMSSAQDALPTQDASSTHDAPIAQNVASRPFITITLTPWPDRLEVSVIDEGHVPPPGLTVPPPPSSSQNVSNAELKESGLGLFLMEALMDVVEHQTGADSNTVVRLVKYTRQGFSSSTSP